MKAFITGASSGLGEALAREFASRYPGCVLGLSARSAGRLQALADSLSRSAVADNTTGLTGLTGSASLTTCHIYPLDVTDSDALKAACDDFTSRGGAPDIVIANAGISAGTQAGANGDGEVFRRIMQVNVCGLQTTLDTFVPAMQAAGHGTLVGIGSVAGMRGLPGAGAYSASKAAVHAYLESLRVELHQTALRVVTIVPGYIRTPLTRQNKFPMPFLMPADKFASKAVDAIASGRGHVVIPWQMGIVAAVISILPNPVFDRLFARAPRKSRRGDDSRSV